MYLLSGRVHPWHSRDVGRPPSARPPHQYNPARGGGSNTCRCATNRRLCEVRLHHSLQQLNICFPVCGAGANFWSVSASGFWFNKKKHNRIILKGGINFVKLFLFSFFLFCNLSRHDRIRKTMVGSARISTTFYGICSEKKIIFMGTFLLVHKYLERFSFVKIKLSQIENANKLLFFSSPTPHPPPRGRSYNCNPANK